VVAVRAVAVRAVTAARAVVRVAAATAAATAVRVAAAAPCLVGRGAAAKVAVVMGCSHRNSGSSGSLRRPSRLSRKHLRRGERGAAIRACLVRVRVRVGTTWH
jgi:hypothetical protein